MGGEAENSHSGHFETPSLGERDDLLAASVGSAATPAVEKHYFSFTNTICRVRVRLVGYA